LLAKTFDILPEIIMEYVSDLGSTLPYFEFLSLSLNMFGQNLHFCAQSFNFDQTYLKYRPKNVEELSLDLIFHNNLWCIILKVLVSKTPS
jgi:hypothetical protein